MGFHDIPYKVYYRAVKYPRLEFKTGKLIIVLPMGHEPEVLLEKYQDWIRKKLNFIEECIEYARGKQLVSRTEKEFRELVHSLANETAKDLNVGLNRVYFRRMSTKWASLSSAKNLTVNRLMKYLPEYLIRYVIFHELVHIIERKHNENFWRIVSRRYENYREMEREMFVYWFLIHTRQ